jgi:DNA polymerase-3 subunit epsilon
VERLPLRLRLFLFFAALAAGGVIAVAGGLWLGFRRLGEPAALSAFVTAGAVAGFAIVGLCAWVWFLFDEHVAKAVEAVAAGLRARAHAGAGGADAGARARYLGDLAPAARAVAERLAATQTALALAVERETTRLATEKARLEALLADVPEGVLLCSAEHTIVFYNGQAAALVGGGMPPGLDRPVFRWLREGPIRHAYERLLATRGDDAASDLLCATTGGGRVLSARMRLLRLPDDAGGLPGYVLTLRDITTELATHARRERLLEEIFDRIRRPAANLQTVIGALGGAGGGGGEGGQTPALDAALAGEARALAAAVTELGRRYDESRAEWWPMSEIRARDLADGIAARLDVLGVPAAVAAEALMLRCDAFQIVALVARLAERLAASGRGEALAVAIRADPPSAAVEIGWSGAALPVATLEAWLAEPLEVGLADVTGRTVLSAHGTELWPEAEAAGRARLLLPVRAARPAVGPPHPAPRIAAYDFDLLARARVEALSARRLAELTYVVFDTETTGLLPSQGDEIVQIAAVRLVNGRIVAGERFESLVNPGRPIPAAATAVHGITEAMVAGAPPIETVGRRFHAFAEGAVLVAHNAPFDLEFLRRHEAGIGRRFDHPVLDTVLLSAVLYGGHETHSLDALAERLGIAIRPAARHTAMGDTLATAEAFLRMLPMLEARGLSTFGVLVAELKRHGRILRDLN